MDMSRYIAKYKTMKDKDFILRAIEFDVDIGWAIIQHRKYVLGQIEALKQKDHKYRTKIVTITERMQELEEQLARTKTGAGIDAVGSLSDYHAAFATLHEDSGSNIKKLRKLEEELRHLNGFEQFHGDITREDIEFCRTLLYYQVLDLPKDNTMIVCPFHAEKTPSFLIRGTFGYCFGCGAHEDTVGLMMRRLRVDFITAIRELLTLYKGGQIHANQP